MNAYTLLGLDLAQMWCVVTSPPHTHTRTHHSFAQSCCDRATSLRSLALSSWPLAHTGTRQSHAHCTCSCSCCCACALASQITCMAAHFCCTLLWLWP